MPTERVFVAIFSKKLRIPWKRRLEEPPGGLEDALVGLGDALGAVPGARGPLGRPSGKPLGRLGRPFWVDLGKTLEEPP